MNNNYNKEKYKQIAIRISPEEADEIKAKATAARLSIARLIVLSVRAYQPQQDGSGATEETLTASTDSPRADHAQPTGQNPTPSTTPTAGTTGTPTEPRQDSQPDYISNAGEDAQRATQNAEDIRTEIIRQAAENARKAARKAYRDEIARQRIRTRRQARRMILARRAAQRAAQRASKAPGADQHKPAPAPAGKK